MSSRPSAYVCLIIETNISAIRSEHPKFDMEKFVEWRKEHEDGYFIRYEGHPFDCKYLDEDVFKSIFAFESADTGALFRRIVKL